MNQRELPKPGRGLRGWAHGNSGATRQEEVPLPGGFGADGPSSPRRTPPRLLAQPRAPPPPPRSPRPRGVRPRPAAPVSPPRSRPRSGRRSRVVTFPQPQDSALRVESASPEAVKGTGLLASSRTYHGEFPSSFLG